jgi:hypothetical protein
MEALKSFISRSEDSNNELVRVLKMEKRMDVIEEKLDLLIKIAIKKENEKN